MPWPSADLDHFKRLNDTYGHETGDRALSTFSKCLRDTIAEEGIVARFGGEELVVAFPERSDEEAVGLLEAVQRRLAGILASSDLPTFTVSVGLVDSEQSSDLAELIAVADAALYRAKREGRHRVVLASQSALESAATAECDASLELAS